MLFNIVRQKEQSTTSTFSQPVFPSLSCIVLDIFTVLCYLLSEEASGLQSYRIQKTYKKHKRYNDHQNIYDLLNLSSGIYSVEICYLLKVGTQHLNKVTFTLIKVKGFNQQKPLMLYCTPILQRQ